MENRQRGTLPASGKGIACLAGVCALGLIPCDNNDGCAILLDERQRPQEGHVELAVDREEGFIVSCVGRLVAVRWSDYGVPSMFVTAADIHSALRQQIFAWADVKMRIERRARRAVENCGPRVHFRRGVQHLPADAPFESASGKAFHGMSLSSTASSLTF